MLAKELAIDESGNRLQMVIDGTEGQVHQIELHADHCDGIGRGMSVSATPPPTEPRVADHNILATRASDGTYSPSRHIEIARKQEISSHPERYVASHGRRLEALRCAGIVERWDEDHWSVPQDLPKQGLAYDRNRHGSGPRMTVLLPISLERQVTHDGQPGATWNWRRSSKARYGGRASARRQARRRTAVSGCWWSVVMPSILAMVVSARRRI